MNKLLQTTLIFMLLTVQANAQAVSNAVTVTAPTCSDLTYPGTLKGTQHICFNRDLLGILEDAPAITSAGELEYEWAYSTTSVVYDSTHWARIATANAKDLPLDLLPPINGTTYFSRGVRLKGCVNYLQSNVITKKFAIDLRWDGDNYPCINQFVTYTAVDNGEGATYDWTFAGANITYAQQRVVRVKFTSGGTQRVVLRITKAECAQTRGDGVYPAACVSGNNIDLKSNSSTAATSQNIAAYPNPVNNMLTIEAANADNTGVIMIYNTLGMLIKTVNLVEGQTRYEAETSSWTAGNYIIKVRNMDGTISSTRIVKF